MEIGIDKKANVCSAVNVTSPHDCIYSIKVGILAHFLQPPYFHSAHSYHSVTVSMATVQQVPWSLKGSGSKKTSMQVFPEDGRQHVDI